MRWEDFTRSQNVEDMRPDPAHGDILKQILLGDRGFGRGPVPSASMPSMPPQMGSGPSGMPDMEVLMQAFNHFRAQQQQHNYFNMLLQGMAPGGYRPEAQPPALNLEQGTYTNSRGLPRF